MATVVATALASAVGMAFALDAYASGHHRLAVFSHPLKRHGHIASADKKNLPPGSVLAELLSNAEVYVSEQGGITCLSVLEATSEGRACGRSAEVQKEGLLAVHVAEGRVRIGVVLPNGVGSVTLVDRDGASHGAKVTNNVVEVYDANVASVHFTMPDGSRRSETIPAAVTHPSL